MKKKNVFSVPAVQSVIASLACVCAGILAGFIALLIIDPSHAGDAMATILKNFFNYDRPQAQFNYFGNTLVKTAPLIMCSLSVLFSSKTGLFNIGAAGQYTLAAGVSLYCALKLQQPWYICLMAGALSAAFSGALTGVLKAFANVNEVISGIMLNWISLYSVNLLLIPVKEPTSPYTEKLKTGNPAALLPPSVLSGVLSDNKYVTIAIPLSIIFAVIIWVILNKTILGYELRATGYNKDAAKYSGMKEKVNIILSLSISGLLAGIGGGFLYLTGFEQWMVTLASVPAMGFNGIAAAYLGGLDPIGTIFASYFIQHITNGGAYLDKNIYPPQISDLISSIIIYLCGFVLFLRTLIIERRRKAESISGLSAENDADRGGSGK